MQVVVVLDMAGALLAIVMTLAMLGCERRNVVNVAQSPTCEEEVVIKPKLSCSRDTPFFI
jgi:hypothetical protein